MLLKNFKKQNEHITYEYLASILITPDNKKVTASCICKWAQKGAVIVLKDGKIEEIRQPSKKLAEITSSNAKRNPGRKK